MREYKFRGRDEHNVWHYGYLVNIRLQSAPRWDSPTVIRFAEIVDEDDLTNRVDPDTVGQFTGMYDAEGREIYEGDIVKLLPQFSVKQGLKRDFHLPAVVKWDERFARFSLRSMEIIDNICHNEYITVIGNVHDNPNLLEEMK